MIIRANPTELYACIYVREFPAQALLRQRPELHDQPCAVMQGEPPVEQVCSLNTKARTLGVTHGMTRVEIETFAALTALTRSPLEEASAKEILLQCAGSFSPRIENIQDPGSFICVVDIAGTEKLCGTPAILAEALLGRVKMLGFTSSIAVCSNFHAAVFLAGGMPKRNVIVIPPGAEPAALASLPVSVLTLSEQHAETLYHWGIYTLGMLAELPEQALVSRLGQAAKSLRMLARGEEPHLFLPVEPSFTLEEKRELESPIELLDSLLFILGLMLEQLIIRATDRIYALASVSITLHLEGEAIHSRSVRPALPTNERGVWLKLIHLDLEAHPPDRAILALSLVAERGSTSKMQLGLFSPQLPEPMRLDVTLARIRAIVGEDFAGKAVLQDHHRRENFRMEQFRIPAAKNIADPSAPLRLAARQLRPPENAIVSLRARRPAWFYYRQKHYVVENAYGPWIASGDWWNFKLWSNDQWDVIARSEDGILLCCCIVRDQAKDNWQIVATYD